MANRSYAAAILYSKLSTAICCHEESTQYSIFVLLVPYKFCRSTLSDAKQHFNFITHVSQQIRYTGVLFITNPRYNKHTFSVPLPFLTSGFHFGFRRPATVFPTLGIVDLFKLRFCIKGMLRFSPYYTTKQQFLP